MDKLNLHQLATFQVVARHCSFVRAAEELHFSQPAVSAQIHHLEKMLDIKLFDKIGRKTHLTHAGETLYLYSQKIFALLDETVEMMDALRSPHSGVLRIGADTTVGTYVIPGLLGKFHELYPAVEIELEVFNRSYLLNELTTNMVDMVVMGKVPTDVPVFAAPLAPNEMVLIAPPTHRLAGCMRIPMRELAREHFLLREVGSGTRDALKNAFEEAGLPLQVSMQVGNNSAIKQSVAAGLGIALISRVAIHLELEMGRLVVLDVEGFPIMRRWSLVHLKEKNLSAPARAFKNFVLQQTDDLFKPSARQRKAV
ncbi:MAG: LysR family transcriptional regulator [Ktedonobacteraceae bacterium]|nr:LysR family transcriptional regulator [Ktedonobacteraceae bacterium]